MDWSVVGLGGVLVVLNFIVRLTPRGKVRLASTAPKRRFGPFIGWTTPLFIGLSMLSGKVPRLLGAPYPILEIFDAVGFLLVMALCVLMIRAALRPRFG